MLPPINCRVSKLEAQHHCINSFSKTINHPNETQASVNVSDQPDYALSMEAQFHYPS